MSYASHALMTLGGRGIASNVLRALAITWFRYIVGARNAKPQMISRHWTQFANIHTSISGKSMLRQLWAFILPLALMPDILCLMSDQ